MVATPPDNNVERRRVEIVHESLLKNWPRLVRWQAQDADGAQLRDELRQAAQLWDQHGRADDYLWGGAAYREYQVWRDRYPGGLTELEQEFTGAMSALALRSRRRRRALISAVLLAAVTITVGAVVLWQRSEVSRKAAEDEARRATANKLLALAQAALDANPTGALAYVTSSLELADSPEARHFAVEALWHGPIARIASLPPETDWFEIRFSPDGRWLATASIDPDVLVFPSSGGPPLALGPHTRAGRRYVEFGPNGDLLATRSVDGGGTGRPPDPILIWSLPEGRLVRTIETPVRSARIRQRGNSLWAFGRYRLTRWSLADGSEEDLGRLGIPGVSRFDLDPTGTRLALARSGDLLVQAVSRMAAPAPLSTVRQSAPITELSFGPSGDLVSQTQEAEISVWQFDGDRLRLRRSLEAKPADQFPRLDLDGNRVAAANPMGRMVRVWDLNAPAEAEPLELRWTGDRLETLDFTKTKNDWLAATDHESLILWPLPPRSVRVLRGHSGVVSKVRFSRSGWLASGSWDGTARVWGLDGDDIKSRIVYSAPGTRIYGMAPDPDNQRILIGDTDFPWAAIARVDGSSPPETLESGYIAPVATAISQDGRLAAVGTTFFFTEQAEVAIRVWDLASGAIVKDLPPVRTGDLAMTGYDGGVWDLKFATDGTLYSAGAGGVRAWDVARGNSRVVVPARMMIMDASDDGRFVLTATRKQPAEATPSKVTWHDLSTGDSRDLPSHGTEVFSIAMDPTATIVVTGSADGTIRAGPVTGAEPHIIYGHAGGVLSVAVSPDGRWIASGGEDGTVRLWPMPDLSKPPLHTLPRDALLAKLREITNLRALADASSPTGYRLDVGPFPGWEGVPAW